MSGLPKHNDPNLLVGFETHDDAGVYRLNDDTALITTADFITPPVDDPYLFGQIGAANALSDVYAMGGRPICCINLIGFPSAKLESQLLHRLVSGALSKITEAGAVLAGGHTTEDEEPKFGLAVTGIVHPQRVWRNAGARPGDALILTKAIGSGVLFNANLKKWVSRAALDACIQTISTLNKNAAEMLANFEVHAVTDVSGFGLAGHAFEMARGSKMTLEIEFETLPIMEEALQMYRKGMNTGLNRFNEQLVEKSTRFERQLPLWRREILYDPQTSGGLLAAVPGKQAVEVLQVLHDGGVEQARIIGVVRGLAEGIHLLFK